VKAFQRPLIKSDCCLVLDEPEVHLHPNWQLKYAEIITLLVKNNINNNLGH
jgi:predicted ATPase